MADGSIRWSCVEWVCAMWSTLLYKDDHGVKYSQRVPERNLHEAMSHDKVRKKVKDVQVYGGMLVLVIKVLL